MVLSRKQKLVLWWWWRRRRRIPVSVRTYSPPSLDSRAPSLDSRAPSLASRAPSLASRAPSLASRAPSLDSRAPSLDSRAPSVKRKGRRVSVKPANKKRNTHGEFREMMPKLREDEQAFTNYFRMKPATFQSLVDVCSDDLTKSVTNFRTPISAEERLVVTLRYLVTGESFRSLGISFRMGFSTVRKIVQETVCVIWKKLQPTDMPVPDEAKWKNIADDFFLRWNFPLCLGATDVKLVKIRAPSVSGSKTVNFQGHHSIVLIAVADAKGRFIIVDVGAYGGHTDNGMIQDSAFYKLLKSYKLRIPQPTNIPGTNTKCSYVFVADDTFPLTTELMRPFPKRELTDEKRVFDKRLLRAKRQINYTLNILSTMWHVLLGKFEIHDDFACDIVKATCVLHNFILNRELDLKHFAADSQDERKSLSRPQDLPRLKGRPQNEAVAIRNTLTAYFNSPAGILA